MATNATPPQQGPLSRANLDKLRRVSRGMVTKATTKLNDILNDAALDRPRKIFQLKLKLSDFDKTFQKLEDLDQQIFLDVDDDDLDDEMENVSRVNDPHRATHDNVTFQIATLENEEAAANAVPAQLGAAANIQNPAVAAAMAPPSITLNTPIDSSNLPKFDLPEFNGDILKWRAFWDVFETEVHLKNKFSAATKFNFLNSRLAADAKNLLAGLTPSNDNYPKAIELLTERFGQPKRIITAHMRALISLPKPSTDCSSLRQFSDSLESNIRGLQALGKETTSYGDLLVCILLDKLSMDVRRNLNRQHGKIDWTLDELRNSLKNEINILDDSSQSTERAPVRSDRPPPHQVGVNFIGTSNQEKEAPRNPCIFCNETGHYTINCPKTLEQRLQVVKDKKLCANCLSPNHDISNCGSHFRCRKCRRLHHSSLHPPAGPQQPQQANLAVIVTLPSVNAAVSSSDTSNPFVFLETAIAQISSKKKTVSCNIFVDKGAQRSFVTTKLVKQLDLKTIRREFLQLVGAWSGPKEARMYDVVQFHFIDIENELVPIEAVVVDGILQPINDPYRDQLIKLPHLQNLKLAHPATGKTKFPIHVLIGSNYYWSIVGDEIIRGTGPVAVTSKLGYLVSGTLSCLGPPVSNQDLTMLVTVNEEVDISRLWDLELLGVQPASTSNHTKRFQIYQEDGVTLQDGRYVAKLPWKENHPQLPSNYGISERRTRGTIKRLIKIGNNSLSDYNNMILEQLKSGYIEEVPEDEIYQKASHYVPHFGVFKQSETTPLRVVYDCSCKSYSGVSLNDCLEIGPPLQNNMIEILLRFRAHRYGLSADICKAFHQILLHPSDRDFLRFFWIRDIDNPLADLKILRFRVVPFGANSSPFILLTALKKHLSINNSTVAKDVLCNLYVDNLISGCDNREEAAKYYSQAISTLQEGGFQLKTWASNEETIVTKAAMDEVASKSRSIKVLGLNWECVSDQFILPAFNLDDKDGEAASTKRSVLRDTASIYDPLGLITPITIPAKILLQDLWKSNLGWDDPLTKDFEDRWTSIRSSINQTTLTIPRSYFGSIKAIRKVHIFVDASPKAFGAVVYMTHGPKVTFVMSKSRVAPLKNERTLPQLELMGAIIGVRLAVLLTSAFHSLDIGLDFTIWTDSQIVLFWLRNNSNKNQFVSNRVSEIHLFNGQFDPSWRYVPTDNNPADLLTRGLDFKQFHSSTLWASGPEWLSNEDRWPHWDHTISSATVAALQVVDGEELPSTTECQLDIQNYIDPSLHNWRTLMRTTAIVLRFLDNVTLKDRSRKSWRVGHTTGSEIQRAEKMWLRSIQRRHFQREIEYLQLKKGPRPNLVSQLDLFQSEDGLLRCRGRLQNASIIESSIHPILLPKTALTTGLIIDLHHLLTNHGGEKLTVSSIRQRFWIPQIRQRVKTKIHHCVWCRKINGPAYRVPNEAPLPAFRVSDLHPFTATGIDFAGPFIIRGPKEAPKKDRKVYILLFTCTSSRGVHLEVVEDLTTKSFIEAFRCFTAHHSLPTIILSDNATTFESAAKTFQRIFRDASTHRFLSDHHIDWRFIPKRAPNYGGFWERLVGITKMCLKKMLGRAKPTLSEFRAIVAEAEATINDRPIEQPSSSFHDGQALTPSHLLYGRRISTLPNHDGLTEEMIDPTYGESPSDFKKAIVRHQNTLTGFKKAFLNSYLPSLREYHSKTKKNTPTTIKIGEVVMVHDEKPRNLWKMAVVESLITSADGQVRAANIRTDQGQTSRPVSKLYPIQLSVQIDPQTVPEGSKDSSSSSPSSSSIQNPQTRPKRRAAEEAEIRIRRIAED